MPALCLQDFGVCTHLLSKYISSLWLYASASPAGTLVYPPATALEMSSLSAPSAVPWPQALPGALIDCSVAGSLAICSFAPPPCCLFPCHPLSSVSLLVLSKSRHITHHIHYPSLCSCSGTTACDQRSGSRAGQRSANSHRLTSARRLWPGRAPCSEFYFSPCQIPCVGPFPLPAETFLWIIVIVFHICFMYFISLTILLYFLPNLPFFQHSPFHSTFSVSSSVMNLYSHR